MAALNRYFSDNYSVYPGEYTPPSFNWDELKKDLDKSKEGIAKPSTNMRDMPDHYLIEMMAPGHEKHDFIVSINNKLLSILVLSSKPKMDEENYATHEFNTDSFLHKIELPENIDTDFMRAEYNAGILSFCFPKIKGSTANLVHRIIIY